MTDLCDLVKINFPIVSENSAEQMRFTKSLLVWLDREGLVYNHDYRLEWIDTGRIVPTYIYCRSDLAIFFKLKHPGC